MGTNYSLLFHLKKPKNHASGPVPIYMRIAHFVLPVKAKLRKLYKTRNKLNLTISIVSGLKTNI